MVIFVVGVQMDNSLACWMDGFKCSWLICWMDLHVRAVGLFDRFTVFVLLDGCTCTSCWFI